MFILRILFAPLSLILSLFVWLCAGLLSISHNPSLVQLPELICSRWEI